MLYRISYAERKLATGREIILFDRVVSDTLSAATGRQIQVCLTVDGIIAYYILEHNMEIGQVGWGSFAALRMTET